MHPRQERAAIDNAVVSVLIALMGARLRNISVERLRTRWEHPHPNVDVLMVVSARPRPVERCTDREVTPGQIRAAITAQSRALIVLSVRFHRVGSDEIEITIDAFTEPG